MRPACRLKNAAIATLVIAFVLPAAGGTASASPAWRRVAASDGILVTRRDVPGRGFPTFRATGLIQASLFDVLAVLSDTPRFKDWMARCRIAMRLRKISEMEYIIYMRTNVPWPLSDRDAVYHSQAYVDLEKMIVDIRFEAVESALKGPVSGVVRMQKLQGHYKLTAKGPKKTHIDYQVDADPQGSLPRWIARLATKRLPLNMIKALRKQVKKTHGLYRTRILRWKTMARKMAKKAGMQAAQVSATARALVE